jgi:hypothetical protein
MENEVKNVTPPTVTVTPTATQPSFISTVAGGAWRGASSFVGLASRFTPRPRFKVEETICYSVHPSFYLWPLIIFGWIIGALIHYNPSHALGYSWMYIWILFYTTMMLMFDIGAIKLVVASAFLGLIIVSAKYIEEVRHIILLGHIFKHFQHLQPTMSYGVPAVLSWMFFIPWSIMAIEAYRSGRKSFSPNGIEERSIGIGREVTDRSGMHFTCHYPDLLETFVGFGSGSLTAMDSNNKTIKEWHNILGLYFIWPRIDEILHQRSAVVDNAANDPVEVENVRREQGKI